MRTLFKQVNMFVTRLPPGYTWSEKDARLETMHWALDIGALEMARDLSAHFKTYLLYAKYS